MLSSCRFESVMCAIETTLRQCSLGRGKKNYMVKLLKQGAHSEARNKKKQKNQTEITSNKDKCKCMRAS